MNHKVHHIAGAVIGEMALLYYHQPVVSFHTLGVLALSSLAALAPDIDKPTSVMASHQPFRFLSESMQAIGLPHRGPLHSIPFLVLLYVLLKYVADLPDLYVFSITLAYASHMFLDMFNAAGVMLLYPWKFNFKFLPSFLAVSSDGDSSGQMIIFSVLNTVFYVLIANIVLMTTSHLPIVGEALGMLHHLLQVKTMFLWEPVADFILGFINSAKKILPV